MLGEIHRVLSPTGVYICMTYGVPEQREPYFRNQAFDWNVFSHKVAKPTISTAAVIDSKSEDAKNFHYIFVMRKAVGAGARGEGGNWELEK